MAFSLTDTIAKLCVDNKTVREYQAAAADFERLVDRGITEHRKPIDLGPSKYRYTYSAIAHAAQSAPLSSH